MGKALYRVEKVHNPPLRGEPLLLLPKGMLVRWPERVPVPEVGDAVMAEVVPVPAHLYEPVLTFLFSAATLERCDAAKRIAENRGQRQRILYRFLGDSMVQKMITAAERMTPEMRAEIEALGDNLPLRKVIGVAYSPTSKGQIDAGSNRPRSRRNRK